MKKLLSILMTILMIVSVCTVGCAESAESSPKYVFLFIGDGMTYSQFQLASSYLGAQADKTDNGILDGSVALDFMQFEGIGSVTTYDSSSFCPDSASTATSIASGFFLAKTKTVHSRPI